MNQSGYLSMLPVKAVFAINYFGSSTVNNFLNVYFNTYFDKFQIAILAAIPCFCAIFSPPLWGAIADMLQRQRWVHLFCLVTGCLFMFLIQFTSSSFYWTCIVVFLGNFQSLPTTSLLDQAVLALVVKLDEEYGKQRLFGAVGWGFGAYFTGLVVSKYGISWAFYLHILFLFPSIFLLQMIPASDSLDGSDASLPPLAKTYSFCQGIQCIAKKKDVFILLFVVFLTGLMFGVLSSFLTLYLYILSGNSALIVGIAILCETLSELPAFYFADRIIEKLGIVKVLTISILCYGIRITFYAFMTNAWTALPFELLHGCTFSLAWAACTKYMYAAAPPGTEGVMMGALNAIQNGLGRGAGTLLGGYLYGKYDASFMWLITDLGVPLSLISLLLFSWSMHQPQNTVHSQLLSPTSVKDA